MEISDISGVKLRNILRVTNRTEPRERHYYNRAIRNHELVCVVGGESRVVFDNTVIEDKPGSVILLAKGSYDSDYYADVVSDTECVDIIFDTAEPLSRGATVWNFGENSQITPLFIKADSLWAQKNTGFRNRCTSLLYSILAEMELAESRYVPNDRKRRLDSAVEYIHSHYCGAEFDYGLLPELCGMSGTYFNRLFRDAYHVSPSEYVENLKLQYARELLESDRISVSDTAKMCGYRDIYYFSRRFKQKLGVSPTAYGKLKCEES